MSRAERRWVLAIVAMIALGIAGLSAWAQQAGKAYSGDTNRWKEMATLVEQGQLNLRAAAELAEKHTKGIAFEVRCDIQPIESEGQPIDREKTLKPGQPLEKGAPTNPPPDRGEFGSPPLGPANPADKAPPKTGAAPREQPGGKRLIYEVSCFAKDKLETVRVDAMAKKVIEGTDHKPLP